jgi:hypothetical protein
MLRGRKAFMASTTVTENPTGRLAAEHPGLVKLTKLGWLTKGVVYLLAGLLALLLVGRSFGWTEGGQEASPTGALKEVADSAGGPILLWALAIGLFLYVVWRVVTALLPGSTDAGGWAHRVGYLVSAVINLALGITAVSMATNERAAADGNQEVTDWTQRLMDQAAGRWLVGAVGVLVVAVGVYRLVKGLKRDVNDELDLSRMSPERACWVLRLGAIGEVGRGIALGCIGFFLVRAALKYRADEATGLDGALRRLAEESWGVALVAVVGVGLAAYGVFCLLTFPYRRLEAP